MVRAFLRGLFALAQRHKVLSQGQITDSNLITVCFLSFNANLAFSEYSYVSLVCKLHIL